MWYSLTLTFSFWSWTAYIKQFEVGPVRKVKLWRNFETLCKIGNNKNGFGKFWNKKDLQVQKEARNELHRLWVAEGIWLFCGSSSRKTALSVPQTNALKALHTWTHYHRATSKAIFRHFKEKSATEYGPKTGGAVLGIFFWSIWTRFPLSPNKQARGERPSQNGF